MSKSARPKLLYFVTEDWYFVSHRLKLAIAAKKAGYDVVVVCRVRNHHQQIIDAGLKLIPFENSRGGTNILFELNTLFRLIKLYIKEKPVIIHQIAIKPVLYGSIARFFYGRPIMINAFAGMGWLRPANQGNIFLKKIIHWVIGKVIKSGYTIVQNINDKEEILSMGLKESKVRLISGSGVDLNLFNSCPPPHGHPIVVLPARLLWDKGVGEFIEAAEIILKKNIAVKFVLAGQPDKENPLAISDESISTWVKNGIVTHLGWVSDMAKLLEKCNIVCLPSYGEGLPKSLIEAAAAARPIVTTDVPGCREVVEHGVNGLIVPPKDPVALADALEILILNPCLRLKMGGLGRSIAESKFGIDLIISKTLAVYEESMLKLEAKCKYP
jgi:glycosyltransferase involved in cell wall biosynthesis